MATLLISSMNDDGLADAGAAEQADLAAAEVGLEEVDDLDAGLEHLDVASTARRTTARWRWIG